MIKMFGWYVDSLQAKAHALGNEHIEAPVIQRTLKQGTMTASGCEPYFNLPLAAIFRQRFGRFSIVATHFTFCLFEIHNKSCVLFR